MMIKFGVDDGYFPMAVSVILSPASLSVPTDAEINDLADRIVASDFVQNNPAFGGTPTLNNLVVEWPREVTIT